MLTKFIKNQRGLTLVELLAVVVILGIVSTIAVVSIGNVIQNSREDGVRSDAIQILNAAEIYVAQGRAIGDNDQVSGITSVDLGESLAREGALADVDWEVNRNNTGQLTITTGIIEVGSETMSFRNATVDDINQSRELNILLNIGPGMGES